jgi:hypothetical protein
MFSQVFSEITDINIIEPNTYLFGDNYEENSKSTAQRKDFLQKISQAEKDVIIFVEDVGIQFPDFLSGLYKEMQELKNKHIKVINVETRFVLSQALKYFDPALLPPEKIGKKEASMSFNDLFEEIDRLEEEKEEFRPKGELRLGSEYRKKPYELKNKLRKFLKQNKISLKKGIWKTALESTAFAEVRREISRLFVQIDKFVFDVLVFYRIVSELQKNTIIIVLMGADHIKEITNLFRIKEFEEGGLVGLEDPFGCL